VLQAKSKPEKQLREVMCGSELRQHHAQGGLVIYGEVMGDTGCV